MIFINSNWYFHPFSTFFNNFDQIVEKNNYCVWFTCFFIKISKNCTTLSTRRYLIIFYYCVSPIVRQTPKIRHTPRSCRIRMNFPKTKWKYSMSNEFHFLYPMILRIENVIICIKYKIYHTRSENFYLVSGRSKTRRLQK